MLIEYNTVELFNYFLIHNESEISGIGDFFKNIITVCCTMTWLD